MLGTILTRARSATSANASRCVLRTNTYRSYSSSSFSQSESSVLPAAAVTAAGCGAWFLLSSESSNDNSIKASVNGLDAVNTRFESKSVILATSAPKENDVNDEVIENNLSEEPSDNKEPDPSLGEEENKDDAAGEVFLETVENEEQHTEVENEGTEDTEEEVDDYSDLPEEDEDTNCAICLINRQGPCRNPWRRFEKCMKDNPLNSEKKDDEDASDESSEDGAKESEAASVASKCDKYFQPWFKCFSRNRLTYTLITNKSIQPDMDYMEEHQEMGSFPETLFPSLETSREQEDEPTATPIETVTTKYATFKLRNEATGNNIQVAYVRDNATRNLLGFDYFTSEIKEGKSEGEMMFHVPQATKSVTLYAFYHNRKSEEEEEKVEDGVVEAVYFQQIDLASQPDSSSSL